MELEYMSFSTEVKNELCSVSMSRACCTRAEAYGALLHASVFSHKEIRLSAENAVVVRRLQALLQRAFFVDSEAESCGRKQQLIINDPPRIGRIFDALGYDRKNHITYHLNRNVLEEDCCIAAFLRGAFLMAGTVAGPDKKSHLELKSTHQSLTGEETSLMLDLGLAPKQARRASAQLLYFKDSASVEDFLTRIGAPHAAMELMQVKMVKEVRNYVNRTTNFETANLTKTASAAAAQLEAIELIGRTKGLESLPDELYEVALLRLQNPDMSLRELGAHLSEPISRSGVNHRLKKILELSRQYAPQERGKLK